MLASSDVLFIGYGTSSPMWYRCALPALYMGADWVGVTSQPPALRIVTGLVHGHTSKPRYDDYKLIIVQQPHGRAWLKQINALKERGIKVLYEIDDYLHGVARQPHHDYAKYYGRDQMVRYEMCMRACDGIICSTPYLARRYAKFNRNLYICRNGLDVNRYRLTRPERSTVNIGWAGATGHLSTLMPWLNELMGVMKDHQGTYFVAIGHRFAPPINEILGEERAIDVPFAPIECYPAAMCMFDVALAPAGDTPWYRAKSDLRFLEASALGIPIIADPHVYPEIEEGVTGFHAKTRQEMSAVLRRLIGDEDLRNRVGEAAREYVHRERSIEDAAAQWLEVCNAVVGEYESVSQLRRA